VKAARTTPAVVAVSTRGGPFAGASVLVLRRRAEKMLAHLALCSVELSVALVDDATIHELNRTYRRKDKPTDVLAFPCSPAPSAGAKAAGQTGTPVMLGDVILSVETARRQAARHRRPLLAELTMLLAHGLLHLLGHDHRNDREEKAMTARTRELEAAATRRTNSRVLADEPSPGTLRNAPAARVAPPAARRRA
jgi:probable rRNA maturation factor